MSNNEAIFIMILLAVVAVIMFVISIVLSNKNNKLEEKITSLTNGEKICAVERKYNRADLEQAINTFLRHSRPSGKNITPFFSYTLTVNNSNNPVIIEFRTLYHKEKEIDEPLGYYTRMFINDVFVLSYTVGYDSFNNINKSISINKEYTVDSVLNMVCSLYENFSSEKQPIDINLLEKRDSSDEK